MTYLHFKSMKFLQKIIDKLYIKQWSIGIAQMEVHDLIRNQTKNLKFKWLPIENKNKFYADPFIFKSGINEYSILFEEYDYRTQYGKISMGTLNRKFEVIDTKTVIDTKSHLSYPAIFIQNGEMYVFPESSKSGKLSVYQYDFKTNNLVYKKDIINLPLIDSTILKYNNKYWIFSTMLDNSIKQKLYIHYSDSLMGPYFPHFQNPVKNNINGSRPAGNLIEVDGILYRPAQNSDKYYGSSITIYKIIYLDENKFIEENYMTITSDESDRFNIGVHTFNHIDDLIVVDGLTRIFLPFTQLSTFLRKKIIGISK